ncbi:MAG: T9SS type A sorting domain-containing protein, partial [Paludibacter sp.]
GKNIEVLVENSTIYGNDSKQIGNGIYVKNVILTAAGTGFGTTNCAAKLTVNHCTIANNISSRTSTQSYGITFDSGGTGKTVFSMNNSIVMGNYCTVDALNTAATTTSNQISAASTFDNITGCITNSITKGGSFTGLDGYNVKNGGASPYDYTGLAFDSGLSSDSIPVLKIGAGSSAIGFVTNNTLTALTTDQLGNSRVANTDAGAYESMIVDIATGIASVQNYNVYLKTNPVAETLLLEGNNISQICIYNALGQKMIQSSYLNGVNVSKLQSGVYFAIVKSDDTKTNTIRFIKQ